jgi:hypothetical protein
MTLVTAALAGVDLDVAGLGAVREGAGPEVNHWLRGWTSRTLEVPPWSAGWRSTEAAWTGLSQGAADLAGSRQGVGGEDC